MDSQVVAFSRPRRAADSNAAVSDAAGVLTRAAQPADRATTPPSVMVITVFRATEHPIPVRCRPSGYYTRRFAAGVPAASLPSDLCAARCLTLLGLEIFRDSCTLANSVFGKWPNARMHQWYGPAVIVVLQSRVYLCGGGWSSTRQCQSEVFSHQAQTWIGPQCESLPLRVCAVDLVRADRKILRRCAAHDIESQM